MNPSDECRIGSSSSRWFIPQAPQQSDSTLSALYETTIELAEIGYWEWNLDRDQVIWNAQVAHLMGLSDAVANLSYSEWRNCLHPDDQKQVNRAINSALADRSSYRVEYRVLYPDDRVQWVCEKGRWCYKKQREN